MPVVKFAKILHIISLAVSVLLLAGQLFFSSGRMQEKAAGLVASYSNSILETEISASNIRFTYPFGIEINGMTVYDEKHDTLAFVSMAIAHFKPGQLLHKKLSINGIRLIHPDIRLSADSIGARPNYMFLAEKLKGSGQQPEILLRANSIVLRNASFRYDILDQPYTEGYFNSSHIGVEHLNTSISIKALRTDTVAVSIRKLRLRERSGFAIRSMHGSIAAGPESFTIDDLTLHTNASSISVSDFESASGMTGIRNGEIPEKFTATVLADITGRDFKAFVPQAASMDDRIAFNATAARNGNRFTVSGCSIQLGRNMFSMKSSGSAVIDFAGPATDPARYVAALSLDGSFSKRLPVWLDCQFANFGISVPQACRNLGSGSFSAVADADGKSAVMTIGLESESGDAEFEIRYQDGHYSAQADGHRIQVGRIAGSSVAGPCSFTLSADAGSIGKNMTGKAKLNVLSAVIDGYTYRNIVANANTDGNNLTAMVNFSDINGSISLQAGMHRADVPEFWTRIDADSVRLYAYGIGKDSLEVSGTLTANISDTDIDRMKGRMSVDSLLCSRPDGRKWHMDNLTATLSGECREKRTATVSSDFFNASMVGEYKLSTLASSFSSLTAVIAPSLSEWLETNIPACRKKITNNNNLTLTASLSSLDFSDVVLDKPLLLPHEATACVRMDESDAGMSCSACVPEIGFGDKLIRGFNLDASLCEGTFSSEINGSYTSGTGKAISLTNVAGSRYDDRDSIDIFFLLEDMNGSTSIPLQTHCRFDGLTAHRLKTSIFIDPADMTFNSEHWKLSVDSISIFNGSTGIGNLALSDDLSSSLLANGIISADTTDVLTLEMNDIDMNRAASLAGADRMGLKGLASGRLDLMGILGKLAFEGSLNVDSLEFMTSKQGNLESHFNWNPQLSQVEIWGVAVDSIRSARTVLDGYYRTTDSFVDVAIDATHTDLHFLNTWTDKCFSEMGGSATGHLRLFGSGSALDLEGESVLENAFFDIEAMGARFIVKEDSLHFEPGKMLFDNIVCYDEYGHDGILNCHLYHNCFHNWKVDLRADVTDMMVYSVPKSDKGVIYATVYAEGSAAMNYDGTNGLDIKVDARTSNGTRIGFHPSTGQVASYNFLSIVDRNELDSDTTSLASVQTNAPVRKRNFNLDLNVECDNSAILDLSMGSLSGLMRGEGNIGINYNRKDGISLNGLYNLSYGMCSLSLEDLIRKDFSLRDGSYVRFNGQVMDTELNLLTYHNVNSASMYDLDPTVTPGNNSRVRCLMDVTGTAGNPQLSFDIDMPNGTSQEKDILASATATEEQRNIQFMYLLAMGRFYAYDVNADDRNASSPSAMESIVNSAVSGQVNNILSSLLNSDKFTLSSNLSAGSYLSNDATNLSNKELEGILEAHLLDNRLLVNGNFGYRENTINNTSDFIGDVEVRYKLFPRQGISLKGYNKSNDKYFSKTTLTTQGVGLVFEKDF